MKDSHTSWPKANWGVAVLLALISGILHAYHVSTLFENDRHFSHLSNLEREMAFRTEMGFYFSYYKRIIQAPTFLEGFMDLTHDNTTEYPSTINTLKRFNVYPEVVLGAGYRAFTGLAEKFGLQLKQCWQVNRGLDLEPIESCEGLGDPVYFYLTGVWVAAGFSAALLFIYGVSISDSLLGGLITILCFFYNHTECTRVQWGPPLRESFSYPFVLAQLLAVTQCLKHKQPKTSHLIAITMFTAVSLLTWQFVQFVLLTQIMVIFSLYLLDVVRRPHVIVICLGQALGLQNAALLLFANEMLLSSFYTCILMSVLLVVLLIEPLLRRQEHMSYFGKCLVMVLGSIACSSAARYGLIVWFDFRDDAHIFNILRSKFSNYRDFHTMLYTCAAEFDFLGTEPLLKMSETFLLPVVYLVIAVVALHYVGVMVVKNLTPVEEKVTRTRGDREVLIKKEEPQEMQKTTSTESVMGIVEGHVIYTIAQSFAFTAMAALIMRLKLFMSPALCVLASLLASRKYFCFISPRRAHYAIVIGVLAVMSFRGVENLREQHSVIGEYSNPELEELLTWINAETGPKSSFAGPMPLMASILLSTNRPVVNHPHYEDAGLRARTKRVYGAFGRGLASKFYNDLVELSVNFLVIQHSWCFGGPRTGCSMLDIWDIVEPQNQSRPPLCRTLFYGSPSPFVRVFENSQYSVLNLPSQYVELPPPKLSKL